MTGTIFDVKHFAVHDGDGIRTTVFLKGCGLKCIWCHNPESISPKPQLGFWAEKCTLCGQCARVCEYGVHVFLDAHRLRKEHCVFCGKCEKACPTGALSLYGREVSAEDLLPELMEDQDFYLSSGGGVTLSGGECLLQADFCEELLKTLKKNSIHTAVDTCGFVSRDAFDKVLPYTDTFLYDIKAMDETVHILCTGHSNKRILENLKYIDGFGKEIEIRIPYVPQYNAEQIPKIAEFISGLKSVSRVKVLAYHNLAGSKYRALGMENAMPEALPSKEEIAAANHILESYHLNVK